MTVEEIDIIVTAKVEEALKEFSKLAPAIKKQMKKAQQAFSSIEIIGMHKKIEQAVTFIKKKMQDLKKSNANNEIAIKVSNKEAQKQISQIQKQIDILEQKINARQIKLDIITTRLDEVITKTTNQLIAEENAASNPQNTLGEKQEYTTVAPNKEGLVQGNEGYSTQLEAAKSNMSQLNQETSKTGSSQNRLTSFFGAFKEKLKGGKIDLSKLKDGFGKIPNIVSKITGKVKQIGSGIKAGIKNVLKYAMSLFSLQSIYSVLSNAAQSWLSSQNADAQQLSANIEYMKYAMGSVFAPIIQYVVNLVYQLMKAIQSVVYAFSGVNIFAKATASSMKNTAGSAKQTSKSLAGIHNEINNVSEGKDDKGAGGAGAIGPNMDLSQVDTQMNPMAQKLYEFFKPLKESWDTYSSGLIGQVKTTAGQIGGLISSVWGSFEKIITNGTVYSILENIFGIIGNIAEAFSNAWNYNGNGDAIVQNLADTFNNLLGAINNIVKSEGFQEWLENCSGIFKEITDKLAEIDWQPLMNALTQIGTTIGTVALEILKGLVEIFKWLVENPIVGEILIGIAIAIGVVSAAMSILNISLLPLIVIIAIITAIVVAIMNWDAVMKFIQETIEIVVNAVVGFFTNLWNQVSFIFQAIWEVISTILGFIWNMIATVFEAMWNIISPILNAIWSVVSTIFGAIWNIISTILGSIWNVFSQVFNWIWQLVSKVFEGIWNVIYPIIKAIWEGIKSNLEKIQQVWSNIWNAVSRVVTNIWNGIWNCIKGVINSILSGIEGMVNGVIKGINFILGSISNVANAIGSIIGLDPINLKLNYVSLPRLAKGGVLTKQTMLIAGEYAGASSNPEIVTPQNIMYETMLKALSDNGNGDKAIYLTVNVGNKKLGQILLEDLKDMRRRSGKQIEALIGG